MEESISGFRRRGDWIDVVEHGEQITQALQDIEAYEEYPTAFEAWDRWRPKAHERIEEDVNKKTAEQAHIGKGKGEKAGKAPNEDVLTAGKKISESYEKLDEDTNEAVSKWSESIEFFARAADSAGRKAVRKVEDTVYKQLMTQLAPYYFDNELVSANVQEVGRGKSGEEFVFEVNINDDLLKVDVSKQLEEYKEEIDRWHVTTEKDTKQIEAAEGAEPVKTEDDEPSQPTQN